jgi:hypothetical protein
MKFKVKKLVSYMMNRNRNSIKAKINHKYIKIQ